MRKLKSYKEHVKEMYPEACYMYFANSEEAHNIRMYYDRTPYGKTLGCSNEDEFGAWKNAYEKMIEKQEL